MAGEKAFSLVCAVLTVLLVRGNLVQMKPPSISCSLGETGFLNSSLVELIRYSDVVLAGRVIDTERGEFGGSNAIVSYFFAYKTDGLLIRRLVWYTTVVGFSSPPPRGQLNLFFLMRQPTTMTLSLLCMSNNSAIWSENSINYIKEASRNETMKVSASGPIHPNPCDVFPGHCGPGASCTALVSPVRGNHFRCACKPGFYRLSTMDHCQPRRNEDRNIYCSKCSHNARCSNPSFDSYSSSSYNHSSNSEWVCTCDHLQCESVLKRPLCGSDGRSYEGECQVKLEACRQQKFIYRLYGGMCKKEVMRPCVGLGEPLTTSAGMVTCQGPSNACPPQHFCHSLEGHYSACCPVLRPVTTPTSETTPVVKTTEPLIVSPTTSTTTTWPEEISGDGSGNGESSGSGVEGGGSWGSGLEE